MSKKEEDTLLLGLPSSSCIPNDSIKGGRDGSGRQLAISPWSGLTARASDVTTVSCLIVSDGCGDVGLRGEGLAASRTARAGV